MIFFRVQNRNICCAEYGIFELKMLAELFSGIDAC